MTGLKTIRLYGRLKKKFGPEFSFAADTAAECIRALCTVVPGFEDELRKGQYRFVRGDVKTGLSMNEGLIHLGLGKTSEVHLVPCAPMGKKGFGKILLGAVLIGAAFLTGGASFVTAGQTLASGAVVTSSGFLATGLMGFVAKVGLMMVLGGISTLLAPKPKMAEPVEKKDSFIFSGAQNTATQGTAVPVIYGLIMAGSVVVSAGIHTEQLMSGGVYGGSGYGRGVGTDGIGGRIHQDWEVSLDKGGKGGSGSGSGQEDPNSLQSTATARVIDLISEGPIGGLAAAYESGNPSDALKSVYFDDVPVQNPDGSYNFKGMMVEQRLGNPADSPMEGFDGVESENSVNVEVTTVTPIIRSVLDTDVDSVRITLAVPSLYKIDADKGSMKGTTLSVAMDVREDGGAWTQVAADTINGKTNTAYQRAYRIALPGDGPWDIRVRRITPDSEDSKLQNDLSWSSYAEIIESKLMYPNSAMMGVTVDARQFGTSIPNRAYKVYGRIIQVPTNYDPETREYATTGPGTTGGVWDGTFKDAWTNNPAWILYDLITHERYGLGQFVPAEYPNKWALYEIGQYCDELVPDGFGGEEPRYTINTQITDRGEAWDLLMSIVSVFRGMFYWGSGAIDFSYDHDEPPSKIVTKANVIDGKINYSSDTFKGRHSVVIVSWNDPEINYRTNYEIVEDDELIAKYGYKTVELAAWGCTSRAQARRSGLWVLETEKYGELATYQAGLDHSDVRPGSVVEVNDPEYSAARMAGRTGSDNTVQSIALDAPVTLEVGKDYTVRVVLPDGTVEQRDVTTAAGTTSTLNWLEPVADPPVPGGIWSLAANDYTPRLFRVIGVEETSEMEFGITAVWHDPNKFPRVEQELDLPPNNYSNIPTGALQPPSDVQLLEFLYREGDASMPGLMVSWSPSPDPRTAFYQYQLRRPSSTAWEDYNDTTLLSDTIRDIEQGDWSVRVRSANYTGQKSIWIVRNDVSVASGKEPIPPVDNLVKVRDDGSVSTRIVWDAVVDEQGRPVVYDVLFSETNDIETAVLLATVDGTEYIVTRTGYYWIRPRFGDTVGEEIEGIQITPEDLPADGILGETLTEVQSQLDDLVATYGDTASASASAAAAEAAKTDAVAAASAADGYATVASTKRDEAQGFSEAAEASAVTASSASSTATSAASAASGSAASASSDASSAASSASLAAGYAGTATTQAGIATTQAAAATASASAASSSATLSSSYSSDARLSAASTLPGTFEADGDYFFESYSGSPETRTPIGTGGVYYFVETVAGVGKVLRTNSTASNRDVAPIGVLKVVAGRTYRATATFRTVSGTRSFAVYLLGLNDTYTYTAVTGNNSTFTATTTWQTKSVTLTGDVMLAAGITYVRCLARFNAGTESGQIAECRVADITESTAAAAAQAEATSQASIATSQATIATAQASAAQTSAVLAASVGKGYQNANSNFADWPNAGHTNPGSGWGVWNSLGGTTVERYLVSSMGYAVQPEGSPYAMHSVVTAAQETGLISVDTPASFGLITVEASAYLSSGGWGGSGVLIYYLASGGSIISSDYLAFASEADSGGSVSATATGRLRKWSKQFTAPSGTAFIRIYAMSNYSAGFGTMAAKNMYFLKCGWKQGGATEATVSQQASVLATHESKLASYVLRTSAGSGTAEVSLVALDSGGVSASQITLKADKIKLGSITQPALEVSGGNVYFNGMLNVGPATGERINITSNLIAGYYSTGQVMFKMGFA